MRLKKYIPKYYCKCDTYVMKSEVFVRNIAEGCGEIALTVLCHPPLGNFLTTPLYLNCVSYNAIQINLYQMILKFLF